MSKKKKAKRTNPISIEKVVIEDQPSKSNKLVFGGVLLAMISIALLIFVLSEKVFHLN